MRKTQGPSLGDFEERGEVRGQLDDRLDVEAPLSEPRPERGKLHLVDPLSVDAAPSLCRNALCGDGFRLTLVGDHDIRQNPHEDLRWYCELTPLLPGATARAAPSRRSRPGAPNAARAPGPWLVPRAASIPGQGTGSTAAL